MKNRNRNIIIWFSVAALLLSWGAWKGTPQKSAKEQSCAERLTEYEDIAMRIIGISSNIEPQDQLSFNDKIDSFRSQMSHCSSKEKEHIKQASRIYKETLFSHAQDILTAISKTRDSEQAVSFNPSEESNALLRQLEQYTSNRQHLEAVAALSEMVQVVFSNYHELSETKKNLAEVEMKRLLKVSNIRTEEAFSRLFNEN
ncbi:MAG: hypothetical protein EA357_01350 [Micavibrio sp.]|nr:MAG: hypothetical protein EA357_01350 [Micavibrio sp.]